MMASSPDTSPASCVVGNSQRPNGSARIICSLWSGRRSLRSCTISRPWSAFRRCPQPARSHGKSGSHDKSGSYCSPRFIAGASVRKVNKMKEAVIVSGVRTAVGRAPRGTLRATYPDDMAGAAIKEELRRPPGLDPAEVEDEIIGCALPEGTQGLNLAL